MNRADENHLAKDCCGVGVLWWMLWGSPLAAVQRRERHEAQEEAEAWERWVSTPVAPEDFTIFVPGLWIWHFQWQERIKVEDGIVTACQLICDGELIPHGPGRTTVITRVLVTKREAGKWVTAAAWGRAEHRQMQVVHRSWRREDVGSLGSSKRKAALLMPWFWLANLQKAKITNLYCF